VTVSAPSDSAFDRGTATLPAAALFDMDGLLIDTEPLWFSTETRILNELGGSWHESDHAKLVGSSLAVASAYISRCCGGRASPAEIAELMVTRMVEALRHAPPLRPGVTALFAELDAAGVAKALVSSSAQILIDAAMEGFADLSFDAVVAGDAVANHKPHPEPYLTAAAMLGADPRWCVAFEDSPTGVASAGAAGCMVVAVPSVVSIEPADRRVVVGSLEEVDLELLRSLFR
jgi:HAD superfamily hydrolase (TIGR01509 family)